MVFHHSGGDSGDSAVYHHRRRSSAEPVELAAADAFRLASDYLLASDWTAGAVPDSLWPPWMARSRPLRLSPSHERALREHVLRGAGTVPASHARTVGFWVVHRPEHQREQGTMKPKRGDRRVRCTSPVYPQFF